jgi:branched-chain amino acid transport system ATP-binding protein
MGKKSKPDRAAAIAGGEAAAAGPVPDDRVALRTEDLSVGYMKVAVASQLNIVVNRGEVVALLGRNGAGKSTTLHTIAGLLPPIGGRVEVAGGPSSAAYHKRVRNGLGFVTESRAVIRRLSVADNLKLVRGPTERAYEIFPELWELRDRYAGLLSGGEQQMLALGKFLAGSPKLLLLDEISLGLGPLVVQRLLRAVRQAANEGSGILLVEQQLAAALTVGDRAYVLAGGQIRLEDECKSLRNRIGEIEALYLAS